MTIRTMVAVLFIAAVLLPATAPADSGDYDRGVAYLRAGKAAEALTLLEPLAASRRDDPYLAYHTGLAYYRLGRLDDAFASYAAARKLTADKPDDGLRLGVAFSNLGVAYYRDGKNDSALACMREALAIEPGDGDSMYYTGLIHIELGEFDKAVEELTAASLILKSDDAASAAVMNALGMALMKKGDADGAISEFSRTLEISPDNVEALYYLGQLNYKEHGYAAAKPYFDRLTHAPATDPQTKATLFTTFFNMGVDFQDRGMSDTAAEMFERASALDPSDAETHYYRGYNLMALERYGDSVAEFKTALSLDPGMKRASSQMEVAARFASEQAAASGRERLDRAEYYAAIPYYEKAVSLDPKNTAAVAGLASANRLAAKDTSERVARSRAHLDKGEYALAVSEADGLAKLNPGSAEAASLKKDIASKLTGYVDRLLASAAASEKAESLGKAMESYRGILDVQPENRAAKDGLARAGSKITAMRKKAGDARQDGALSVARDSYARLLVYLPGDPEAVDGLAEVEQAVRAEVARSIKDARDAFGSEDYNAAANYAAHALELDPGNDDARGLRDRVKERTRELVARHIREGNAYLDDGLRDKALDSFQAALQLDPGNSAAAKGVERARFSPPAANVEDDVRKLYLEGVEHYTRGELDAAVASWRKVLRLDPSNEKASSSIKRAEEKMKQTGGAN